VTQRQQFRLPATPTRSQEIARVVRALERLPAEKPFDVVVELHRPRRSDAQNRYLRGVVYPTILRAGGAGMGDATADELHEFFLGSHFGWREVHVFGRRKFVPQRRSSALTKMEFVDFVAFVQRYMAERGVVIPDPNEGVNADYGDGWEGG
jgi:hypothetical protein